MVISIKERERESERGDNNNNVKRASTSTRGLSRTRTMGELGMGMGMGATWGVIGKLGGRADSPHYWGWIAFAGRSTVIRVSFSTHNININLNISINKSTINAKDIQCMNQLYSIWIF